MVASPLGICRGVVAKCDTIISGRRNPPATACRCGRKDDSLGARSAVLSRQAIVAPDSYSPYDHDMERCKNTSDRSPRIASDCLPGEQAAFEGVDEAVWIEVIHKMDDVYNDLLEYEVVLEQKNAALVDSQQFIESVLASMSDILIVCNRHGAIQEVFPDVFSVTGTMRGEFFGSMWQFSRNMTIVREGGDLTLFNAVRLDDDGLAALDALGKVKNVVKLGSMHGHDDAFYIDRYGATFWAVADMPHADGIQVDRYLTPDGELPVANASLFCFEATKLPEAILRLDREGGIMIACDSLQNWVSPDEFFLD